MILFAGHRNFPGERTGLEILYFALRELYGHFPTEIRLYEWRDNVRHIADQITAWSADNPEIHIVGYSWGGATADLLARELHKRTISVHRMYLCDAVSRSEWRIRYWRSLWGWGPLRISPNVQRLWSCRQTANYPRQSRLIVDPATVHVEGFVSKTTEHRWMDEHHAFHYHVAKSLEFLAC